MIKVKSVKLSQWMIPPPVIETVVDCGDGKSTPIRMEIQVAKELVEKINAAITAYERNNPPR